jgi:hypothetical protein
VFDAVSLFYQMKKVDQGKRHTLKNNKGNISTKKTELKTTNADCVDTGTLFNNLIDIIYD